jgi:hypothetical protein
VTRGTSILGQVLQMMPRAQIESLDNASGTGRPSRVLSRWSPFGTLVFAQLAGSQSWRDVVTTMASPSTALATLGLTPPKRSTLAEANARRPATLSQTLLPHAMPVAGHSRRGMASGSKARSSLGTAPPSPSA